MISTDAKRCPQCGAKNTKYKSSKLKIIVSLIILVLMTLMLYQEFEPYLNPNIPECDSLHGRKVFMNTFDNSPYAKTNNLKALDIKSQKQISGGDIPEDRVCKVVLRLNNGTDKTYIFSFERTEKGGYFIRGKILD